MKKRKRQADALVRTSVQAVSNAARLQQYANNSDVIRGIQVPPSELMKRITKVRDKNIVKNQFHEFATDPSAAAGVALRNPLSSGMKASDLVKLLQKIEEINPDYIVAYRSLPLLRLRSEAGVRIIEES